MLPVGKLKLNEFGVADRLVWPEEFAFRVTGIVTELEPGPDTLMKPTSVPLVGAPAPMDTWIDSGVGPDLGVTWSQLVSEYAETERLTGLMEEDNNTVWTVFTPFCVLNVSCGGVAVSVAFCACAVSKQHSRVPVRSTVRNGGFSKIFTAYSKELIERGRRRGRGPLSLVAIRLPRSVRHES